MNGEVFEKFVYDIQRRYIKEMKELFKTAGIPEEEFVPPERISPRVMYIVRVKLSENICLGKQYDDGRGGVYHYKFTHHGFPKIVDRQNIEYFCYTLEEAQNSYKPGEVLEVKIEEYQTFTPKDVNDIKT